MSNDTYTTRKTLLQRACNKENSLAWNEFEEYYRVFIRTILRHLRIPEQERDDVTQKILLKLWGKLPCFDSKLSKFRTWLITVIRNESTDHMRKLVRTSQRMESSEYIEYNSDAFSDDELDDMYQKEWEKYITSLAMNRIQKCFSGNAIEVFSLSLAGMEPQEIADKLDIHLHSVYNLKNRVKVKLIDEISHLRSELEE